MFKLIFAPIKWMFRLMYKIILFPIAILASIGEK